MVSQLTSKIVPQKARKLTAATADALRNDIAQRIRLRLAARRDLGGPVHPRGANPEEEIARSLGVSRTPVREALRRLQERGMLVVGAGRSLVVAELSKQQVLELYAMREILEGSAARFAARHANEAEIDMLHRLLDEFDKQRGQSAPAGLPQPPLSPRHLRSRAQSLLDCDARRDA